MTTTPVDVPAGFTADFGPDVPAPEPPKVNQDKPPRKARDTRRTSKGFSLGANTKPRSGIRQLTDDDKPKLAKIYHYVAKVAVFVRPPVAAALLVPAMDDQPSTIDNCVNTWFDVAKENDRIRAGILAMIEGGVWAKLIMAHLPLVIAALPEKFVERWMNPEAVMTALFGQSLQDNFPFAPPQYPADMQQDPNA